MNGIAISKSINTVISKQPMAASTQNSVSLSKFDSPTQKNWTAAIDSALKGIESSSQPSLKAFSQLIKVQGEINHYQLRVEMLSKLSESGLATIRKIQQTN